MSDKPPEYPCDTDFEDRAMADLDAVFKGMCFHKGAQFLPDGTWYCPDGCEYVLVPVELYRKWIAEMEALRAYLDEVIKAKEKREAKRRG